MTDNYNNNPRRNLTLYWKQFYPEWEIPAGFHVHHIKPKCTFESHDDPRIHHPKNLIALHPDDHISIHKCRGDKWISERFILHVAGQKFSDETKRKMSQTKQGRVLSSETKNRISKSRKGYKHTTSAIENMKKAQLKSELTKRKLSDSHRGKIFSEEHCANISAGKKGNPNPHTSKRLKGSTWKTVDGKRVWTLANK